MPQYISKEHLTCCGTTYSDVGEVFAHYGEAHTKTTPTGKVAAETRDHTKRDSEKQATMVAVMGQHGQQTEQTKMQQSQKLNTQTIKIDLSQI